MAGVADAVQIVPPGRLVYGMQLPIQAQSTVFAAPWERDAGPADLVRIAQACDRNGFFYVAVCDHVCVPRERACPSDAVCCFGVDGSGPGGCCRHGQKCQNGTRCVRKKKK